MQKIILGILGLGIIVGVGLLIFGASDKNYSDQTNNNLPVEILDPVDITNPTEPINPVEPANPAEPTEPTDPTDPAGGSVGTNNSEFDKIISFELNDKFIFTDGLEVVLKEINDSRCPEGVQCVWTGEISGLFSLSGGELSVSKEVRLGTVNNKSATVESYVFFLKEATEKILTIEVLKN